MAADPKRRLPIATPGDALMLACHTFNRIDIYAHLCLYAQMRTTIDLPNDLFKEVKTRAAQQGTTLKDLLTLYIHSGLREGATPPSHSEHREPPPVVIPRTPDTPLITPRDNRELHALLEDEEIKHIGRI